MENFPNLFYLAKTMNQFYNEAISILPPIKESDVKQGLKFFDDSKKYTDIVLNNQKELRKEMDLLYENIDKVQFSVD